jgi:hypothetical protein
MSPLALANASASLGSLHLSSTASPAVATLQRDEVAEQTAKTDCRSLVPKKSQTTLWCGSARAADTHLDIPLPRS